MLPLCFARESALRKALKSRNFFRVFAETAQPLLRPAR